jgi:hypothetical protein
MEYEAWQLKRKQLMEREKEERSINWQQSRAPIQAAISEQAIRELYDKVEALEQKRGPGRPPKAE